MHSPARRRTLVILCLFLIYVIWGSTYFAIRIALRGLPPFLMAGSRFLVGGAALYAFERFRGHPSPSPREWGGAALVGAMLLVIANGSVVVAEQWVSSSLTALIISSMPLWMTIFEGFYGSWPRRLEWLGLGVGFAGVALLNFEGEMRASPLGAALLVGATASWALGLVWARRVSLPRGLMAPGAEMVCAGAMLLGISLALGEHIPRWPVSPDVALAWLYLLAFGSVVAFSAFGYLVQNVRPGVLGSYAFVNPVVAVALGVGFAGEHISALSYVAMGIILAAVGMMMYRRSPATPAPAAPSVPGRPGESSPG